MTVGQRLQYLRQLKGLKHHELAKEIGVDRTTVTKWESGGSNPTRYLQKLADFYNVTVDYILNGEEEGAETITPPTTDLLDFIKYGRYTIGDKPVRAEDRKKLLMAIIGILAALPLGGNDGE